MNADDARKEHRSAKREDRTEDGAWTPEQVKAEALSVFWAEWPGFAATADDCATIGRELLTLRQSLCDARAELDDLQSMATVAADDLTAAWTRIAELEARAASPAVQRCADACANAYNSQADIETKVGVGLTTRERKAIAEVWAAGLNVLAERAALAARPERSEDGPERSHEPGPSSLRCGRTARSTAGRKPEERQEGRAMTDREREAVERLRPHASHPWTKTLVGVEDIRTVLAALEAAEQRAANALDRLGEALEAQKANDTRAGTDLAALRAKVAAMEPVVNVVAEWAALRMEFDALTASVMQRFEDRGRPPGFSAWDDADKQRHNWLLGEMLVKLKALESTYRATQSARRGTAAPEARGATEDGPEGAL